MKTKTKPTKPKIAVISDPPELDTGPDAEEIPAGVRLSYVNSYVHRRNQLPLADLILSERIGDLKKRRKSLNKQLDALNRRRPDQQPDDDMPLISGMDAGAPAGTASIEINLDSGRESALAVLGVARDRLTEEEFKAWLEELLTTIGLYD